MQALEKTGDAGTLKPGWVTLAAGRVETHPTGTNGGPTNRMLFVHAADAEAMREYVGLEEKMNPERFLQAVELPGTAENRPHVVRAGLTRRDGPRYLRFGRHGISKVILEEATIFGGINSANAARRHAVAKAGNRRLPNDERLCSVEIPAHEARMWADG